jgi:hypothetical protein
MAGERLGGSGVGFRGEELKVVDGKTNMERPLDKLAGREFRVSSFEFPVSSQTVDGKTNMGRPLDKSAGREFPVSSFEFSVSSFEFRHTDPNKPNRSKAFVVNNMAEKSAKQTQRPYHTCYQLLTAISRPNFGKFGSMGPGLLSGIRSDTCERGATKQCRAKARRYRRRREEFTSKATMCFRMSISEDIRPIRNWRTGPLIHWFIEPLKAAIRFFNDLMGRWRNGSLP